MERKSWTEADIDYPNYMQGAKDCRDLVIKFALVKYGGFNANQGLNIQDITGKIYPLAAPASVNDVMYSAGNRYWSYFQGAFDYMEMAALVDVTDTGFVARLSRAGLPQTTVNGTASQSGTNIGTGSVTPSNPSVIVAYRSLNPDTASAPIGTSVDQGETLAPVTARVPSVDSVTPKNILILIAVAIIGYYLIIKKK